MKILIPILLIILIFNGCGEDDNTSNETNTTTPTEDDNITRADAIRFLKQASLSIRDTDITFVMTSGYEAWLDSQFAKTFENKHKFLRKLYSTLTPLDNAYNTSMSNPTSETCDKEATPKKYRLLANSLWWDRAFSDDDQLRQKVAYALSQIIVVSAESPAGNLLKWRAESLAYYYDVLQKNAFTNYKDLLRDVTNSPTMAYYMTYLGSADYNESRGTSPDENYARELMQLFSIGISELNIDGSKVLENGKEKATYTQEDVVANSKIMTGWDTANSNKFGRVAKKSGCYSMPIVQHNQYHDKTAKTVLGTTIPAGQTQKQDIESLLSILMANKNIAPNISKKLIQRLTTSNPTAGYIKRVAEVFNNDGNGVKGNLKAVVKAVLLDDEARKNTYINSGKVDEILTSAAHLFSTFGVQPTNQWKFYNSRVLQAKPLYWISAQNIFGQGVLSAPDVFNFYDENYAPNDINFSNANLIAPELQIQTSSNLIKYSNFLKSIFKNDKYARTKIDGYANMQAYMTAKLKSRSNSANSFIYVDLTDVYDAFGQAVDGNKSNLFINLKDTIKKDTGITALIDYLDNKMLGGTLPEDYKTALVTELKTENTNVSINKLPQRARNIITNAIRAIVTSPYYMVIK